MEQIFAKVIPIILLIAIGYIMKKTKYLGDSFFIGIKKIVFDFSLPCLLFTSFINMDLKIEYLGLTICVVLLLVFLNSFGRIINLIKPISNPVLPYLMSGTAIGLVGFPLYVTAFGADKLYNLAVLTIGHEIFLWIIFASLMRIDLSGEKVSLINGVKKIFKSPLVLSIFIGIFFNLIGFKEYFSTKPIMVGLYQTMTYFSQLGTPLILLIVGNDLEIDKAYIKMAITYTLIRRISFMGFGLLMEYFILARFMDMTIYHKYAMLTFFMMPPPFAFTTLIEGAGGKKELGILANNVVVLDTILCIISFIVMIYFISI